MSNLYLAFSVVFPLFCMIALGYFLTIIHIFNTDFLKQLNKLCFKIFLPTLLFIHIYKSDFHEEFNLRLIIFTLSCIVISFIIFMFLVPKFEKDNKRRGVIVQGIFRSNYILFGIPITASLYGEGNTSVTTILIAFAVPLFNCLSVIALARFSDEIMTGKQLCKQIIKNPLILASSLAFVLIGMGIELPHLLEKTITDISKIATPLALMILGGTFSFKNLSYAKKALVISILGKLIIMPVIFVIISILFGFRNMELVALFSMFASPTAVSSYTMAESMKADSILAGQIVVVDSLLSILTIFIGITILTQLSLI